VTTTAVAVLARAPLPGRCKKGLLAAHGPEWVAGLVAAMLRDTLDGLQAVSAEHYLVFVAPIDDAFEVLARHVPAPWELLPQEGADRGAQMEHAFGVMFARGASYALLAASDAPSLPTDPLTEALSEEATRRVILVGPSEDGGCYLIGMPRIEPRLLHDIPWSTPAVMEIMRARCREQALPLRELPPWYDVDEPSDVARLLEELRKHPERAPRTAQFLVTSA
jgi:rSAM/selenodomain-associated transferase 1